VPAHVIPFPEFRSRRFALAHTLRFHQSAARNAAPGFRTADLGDAQTMALTLSNRETFLALQWLESDPERRSHFRDLASTLSKRYQEAAIPQLSDAIFAGLQENLPELDGLASQLLSSGLSKINFYELALALILESESATVRPVAQMPLEA
jgi:hypothetical protein